MRLALLVTLLPAAAAGLLPRATATAGEPGTGYRHAPEPIRAILDQPSGPTALPSPNGSWLLLATMRRYPSIRELAQPMERLAGLRLNARTRGPHLPPRCQTLRVVRVSDGRETAVALPPSGSAGTPSWSPTGRHFAVPVTGDRGIELWVAEVERPVLRRLPSVILNAVLGSGYEWMPGGREILYLLPAPAASTPLTGPVAPAVQESEGRAAPVRTFQDLLRGPADDQRFEDLVRSRPIIRPLNGGPSVALGGPDLYASVDPAPGGDFFRLEVLRKPFSRLLPADGFARTVEIRNRAGKSVRILAELPAEESVPIAGVPTGPRQLHWHPERPATLVWTEALDGGDPRRPAEERDRLMTLSAPFTAEPAEVTRFRHRLTGISWLEGDAGGLAVEFERERRRRRTYRIRLDRPGPLGEPIWNRSAQDRYGDPGRPIRRRLPSGGWVVACRSARILLGGDGASPQGDRPFLDRFDLATGRTERLFRCGEEEYATVVEVLEFDGPRLLIRRESPTSPPAYAVREGTGGGRILAPHPPAHPAVLGMTRKLVTYRRNDGVPLSFTLCLPAGHIPGRRLPTLVWAYPREFGDADAAGQVSGSDRRYPSVAGISHLFLLTQGYAILDGAAMPVIGGVETANDTFVEQISAAAEAAIAKGVELGVVDPDRVAVGGHSYGAFMTANLLAHTDLFRAGIARSGAYNRTLTAFGFQAEPRTLWQVPELYARMSPFMHAHRINEPLLLIHGEADNNPGTFPIQSERLFQAVQGNGGIARLVMLPHESHGYSARESVEHTLWEMTAWLDRHVKNAPPRPAAGR